MLFPISPTGDIWWYCSIISSQNIDLDTVKKHHFHSLQDPQCFPLYPLPLSSQHLLKPWETPDLFSTSVTVMLRMLSRWNHTCDLLGLAFFCFSLNIILWWFVRVVCVSVVFWFSLPSSIPWYGETTVCSIIYPCKDIGVASNVWCYG